MIDFNKKRRAIGYVISTIVIVSLILISINPSNNKYTYQPLSASEGEDNMSFAVSTGTEGATDVGKQILLEGGNAIDAAIAVSFSLGVTSPQSSGIGGGGVMLVYDPVKEETFYYDFYNSSGQTFTGSQIGIPGFLKGMELAFNEYATLPIESLLKYPIQQAEEGFIINSDLASGISLRPFITEVNSNFIQNGKILGVGDKLVQPDLAETLKLIETDGFNIMYDSSYSLAQNFMEVSGVDLQSLQNYQAFSYPAIETTTSTETIYGAGSPFSSSTAIQMYQLLNDSSLNFNNGVESDEIIEYDKIYNYAYEQNQHFVGDQDIMRQYNQSIIEKSHILETYTGDSIYDEDFSENENTISYSIIDSNGMIVVGTNTLSNLWGSAQSADGIFYNNSLKNFSSTEANKWEPMKRPKTFISPVIIHRDSDNIIGMGASGGNTIPQVISTILSMHVNDKIPFEEAIDTQRFARNNDKYRVEHPSTRSNKIIYKINDHVEVTHYKEGGYFNAISLVSKSKGNYEAYFETMTCTEGCGIASNVTE